MILIFLHDGNFMIEKALVDIGFRRDSLFHSAWISGRNGPVQEYQVGFKGTSWFLQDKLDESDKEGINEENGFVQLNIDQSSVKLDKNTINDVIRRIGNNNDLQMQAVVLRNAHDNYNKWMASNSLGYVHRGYRGNEEDHWAELGPVKFWIHFWTRLIAKLESIDEKIHFFNEFHFLPLEAVKQAGDRSGYEY